MTLTRGIVSMVLAALAVFTVCAEAEDSASVTPREEELLQKLEAVIQRLEVVETELAELKAKQAAPASADSPAPPDLEERIAELEKERESSLQAVWKDGLRFQSPDGDFKLQIGGRLFVDYTWFDQDNDLKLNVFDEQDGGQIRMGRLDLRGEIYKDLFYRIEYDFAGNNGPGGFTDTYLGLKNIPYLGTLTIGHFKEPFSLEELTSDSFITFMERSLPTTFSPARNLGVQLSNAYFGEPGAERFTYAAGVFKGTDNWPSANDADEDQGVSVTARLTGLPWYDAENKRLLHLGMAYSHRNPDGAVINAYQLRPTPESRFTQFRWLDSEGFALFRLRDAIADNVDLWGFESALAVGPFSLQGEYMLSQVETRLDGDLDFDGYYVQASYMLTGESRPYKTSSAVFDRVKPKNNFGWGKGWGAWELALRYSSIDLNDGGVWGGEEDNFSVGLNWYLTPNARWMLNYVMADIEHPLYDGDLNMLQTRFQIDF